MAKFKKIHSSCMSQVLAFLFSRKKKTKETPKPEPVKPGKKRSTLKVLSPTSVDEDPPILIHNISVHKCSIEETVQPNPSLVETTDIEIRKYSLSPSEPKQLICGFTPITYGDGERLEYSPSCTSTAQFTETTQIHSYCMMTQPTTGDLGYINMTDTNHASSSSNEYDDASSIYAILPPLKESFSANNNNKENSSFNPKTMAETSVVYTQMSLSAFSNDKYSTTQSSTNRVVYEKLDQQRTMALQQTINDHLAKTQ